MKKNIKTHLIAVLVAGILSYGLFLIISSPVHPDLSADILGIQRGDVTTSDLLIEQLDDHITVHTNREITNARSFHFLMMYDDEQIDATQLMTQGDLVNSEDFDTNQGVIVLSTPQGITENQHLFTLYGVLKNEDIVLADSTVTFDDASSERLLFAQPN